MVRFRYCGDSNGRWALDVGYRILGIDSLIKLRPGHPQTRAFCSAHALATIPIRLLASRPLGLTAKVRIQDRQPFSSKTKDGTESQNFNETQARHQLCSHLLEYLPQQSPPSRVGESLAFYIDCEFLQNNLYSRIHLPQGTKILRFHPMNDVGRITHRGGCVNWVDRIHPRALSLRDWK